jgi:hypothetical protein
MLYPAPFIHYLTMALVHTAYSLAIFIKEQNLGALGTLIYS